jgi:hypothetical protein
VKVGDKVRHEDYGVGTILEILRTSTGSRCKVDFGYTRAVVPYQMLKLGSDAWGNFAPEADPMPPAEPVDGQNPPATLAHFDINTLQQSTMTARAGVNALKLGQILECHVETLTVGTESDEEQFKNLFQEAERKQVRLVLIEGAWGVGKTHLLTLLSASAAKKQFAISTTILDGVGATLSDPMRLLASITSNIRFPGDAVPMGVGLKLAEVKRSGMPELQGLGADRLLKVLQDVPAEAFHDVEVLNILEDYLDLSLPASQAKEKLRKLGCGKVSLPALRALNIEFRGARFADLLGDWTAFCVGAKAHGLLVVLDELDVDYAWAPRWNHARRTRQDMTLRAIGALKARGIPLVIAFGSAPAGPGVDPESDAARDVIVKVKDVHLHSQAARLGPENLIELGAKIWQLYGNAYPGFSDKLSSRELPKIQRQLVRQYERQLSPVPRRYVRALLHCFDSIDLEVVSSKSLANELG